MQPADPERLVASEVLAREATDYRFRWGTYFGWTILTFGLYSHYGTYRLIQRRVDHAQRRLAFSAGLWHELARRAKDAGQESETQPGLENLSRIHAALESYETANRRNAALMVMLRVAAGGFGLFRFFTTTDGTESAPLSSAEAVFLIVGIVVAVISAALGAYINHFLNKDLRFFETWEDSLAEQTAWVLARIDVPVAMPAREAKIPQRETALYVFLTIITAGLFAIWWRYSMMNDGNKHFDGDEAWEDKILWALGIQSSAVGPPLPPRY